MELHISFKLHASPWNCMQACGTACKLLELHASLWNCMQAHGTKYKLMIFVQTLKLAQSVMVLIEFSIYGLSNLSKDISQFASDHLFPEKEFFVGIDIKYHLTFFKRLGCSRYLVGGQVHWMPDLALLNVGFSGNFSSSIRVAQVFGHSSRWAFACLIDCR